MKPLKIKDPFLFGEWFDIFWFHSCFVAGQAESIRERFGYGLSQVFTEQDGNVLRIYFSRSEWTNSGERFLSEVIKDPQKLESLHRDIRRAADELNAFSDRFEHVDVLKLSPAEQATYLAEYHKPHHVLWALGQVQNVLDLENPVLRNYLQKWLIEQPRTSEEVRRIFQILVTPRELSAAQHEERAMLDLATLADPGEKLVDHWRKYRWLQFGWTGPALSLDYFKEVHKGLRKEGNAADRLAKLEREHVALLREKEAVMKKIKMPAVILRLFRFYEDLLELKTYRMDALFRSYDVIQPLLKKIAADNYLSLGQMYLLYIPWIIDSLKKGTFDVEYINELGKYSVRYFDGEQFYTLVGEEARKLGNPLKALLPEREMVKELNGECAFPGKVRGQVCIVNRASEMGKFPDGAILVSNVTDPTLLPIMKKASAFITNQGGLTCHAAIVARELKTPCLVGTKIATHVFKDGDEVELDAGQGIVKKL